MTQAPPVIFKIPTNSHNRAAGRPPARLRGRATSHAERGWLRQVLNDAAPDGANDMRLPDMPHAPGEPGG